ncbi:MAG: transporter, partial [Coriobacteriia bacterium]|nr:transporter [Coriobacteriia bacterium]
MANKPNISGKAKAVLLLHALLVFYSLSGICAKLAAGYDFLSVGFVGLYGGMIVVLGIYAIGWQQVIKRLPLTFAYANRAVTVVWGIVWGVVFFGEAITPLKAIGALMVLAGVVLYATSDTGEQGEQ